MRDRGRGFFHGDLPISFTAILKLFIQTYTFLELAVDELLTGYDENFVVRERLPLLLRCRIRARNSYGLPSKWKQSSTLKLYKLYPNRKKAIPSPLNEVPAEHGEFKFYR
ncbi:hypothetical protein Ddc_05462 [Ditylenchus destructor]|nr:hypothetical protein Ddc_05462 [Ditylenchus destructor]